MVKFSQVFSAIARQMKVRTATIDQARGPNGGPDVWDPKVHGSLNSHGFSYGRDGKINLKRRDFYIFGFPYM